MAMHLKDGKLKILINLKDVAKNYVEAHATDIVFGLDPKMPKFRSAQSTLRRCYRCGQAGHVSFQCSRKAPEERPVAVSKSQGTPYIYHRATCPEDTTPGSKIQLTSVTFTWTRSKVFLCNRLGHIASNCLGKPTAAAKFQSQEEAFEVSREEVAACQPRGSTSSSSMDLVWKIHKRHGCLECNDPAASRHHCEASSMIAFCQDCGIRLPVVADACQFPDKSRRMPVAEGSVEGTSVNVLRDTGCSTIVVRRAVVPGDKLTGREERCIFVDRTVRYTPAAEIYTETPFFTVITTAVCIKNPLYDLVIGNVSGARDVSISPPVKQTTQAVQTRSQVKKATKGLTPLITFLIDLGTEDIAKLQSEADTLCRAMKSAQQGDDPTYQIQRGFLYRV